jgi:hypothetical protein
VGELQHKRSKYSTRGQVARILSFRRCCLTQQRISGQMRPTARKSSPYRARRDSWLPLSWIRTTVASPKSAFAP